ncbi:MAG: lipoate--protein ligase [Eubacterium sp.]
MSKMVYVENDSFDPTFNLALEQYVFDFLPRDYSYFWLWQNDKTIVVGKHQNTMEEVNYSYVQSEGIRVVRRLSGGGAVYHDLGNINYTFITDTGDIERLNMQAFCQPIVNVLKQIGINAEISGRNDITIEGKKFSGNSQYIKGHRVMHHGTLMFDSDLSVVEKALSVSKDKYESKGVKSVRSRVTNIRSHAQNPVSFEEFKDLLRNHMIKDNEMQSLILAQSDLEQINMIRDSRYSLWDWNYGESPAYNVNKKRRIEGVGTIELCLNVENGRIKEFDSFGDYFGDGATRELKERLNNCPLREDEIRAQLLNFDIDRCFYNLDVKQFIELLVG